MTELPQATSRRELREREAAARTAPRARKARMTAVPKVRTTSRHGIASKLLSLSAMLFAGALAVGMSMPANAVSAASGTTPASTTSVLETAAQADSARTASAAAGAQTAAVRVEQSVDVGTRDTFEVFSWAQVLAQKYAKINNYKYTGGHGSIRWPFPYAVPISSPFGPRIAPCRGCSTFHNGVDFTPGEGAAIFSIADGVVTGREDGTSEYGNFVIITHKIGGAPVTSTYAHMLAGSSPIVLGQTVHVGDFLGLVGMTGEATGPHLHFEIAVSGVRIDPIPWLEAHVN